MIYDIKYMKDNKVLYRRSDQFAETLRDVLEQTRRFWPYAAENATLYVGETNGRTWQIVYYDTITLSMLHERLSHE